MWPAPRLSEVPLTRELWRDVVANDPAATAHQTPEWSDAIIATGGYTAAGRAFETLDGRQLVLPMVRRGRGDVLRIDESLPAAWGSGGIVAQGGLLAPDDVTAVISLLMSDPRHRVRIRPEHRALPAWRAAELPARMYVEPQSKAVVDLDGGFEKVWGRFKSGARGRVRKAERAGLTVESDDTGALVGLYYKLFETWARHRAERSRLPPAMLVRRAVRAEPRRKFEAVASHMASACRVWAAYLDGRPVAAAITLTYGDHVSYWRGSSDPVIAGPTCANDLLQKSMIEYACENGSSEYNMGWSGTDSLIAFKAKFGARLLDYPVFTHERPALRRTERAAATSRRTVAALARRRRGTHRSG